MGKEFKRMRYFDGLLLNAEDYTLDQEYQRRLQQLHSRYLHTWGIVTGLEVKLAPGEPGKVIVTEGLALNQVEAEGSGESISQEIYIYDGHPDNPLDLSKYLANENIYISISYEEVLEDRDDIEKGKGQEIHILERGRVTHSKEKPSDPKRNIILARVKPRKESSEKVIIDENCIFSLDQDDRTELRTYAGPAGRVLALEKIIFKPTEEVAGNMPYVRAMDMGTEGVGLEVDSLLTSFTGKVNIKGNLVVEGNLEVNPENGGQQSELLISNSFVQVNSPVKGQPWERQDGGLEVYRGDSQEYPDARLAWSESEKWWQIRMDNKMWNIAYGPVWERLIKGSFTDDLHKHSQIASPKGVALAVDGSGNLSVNGDLTLKDKTIWFRSLNDTNHGIGWFGAGKPFAGINVDGPVLFGLNGGVLGTTANGSKSVLAWNSLGNVGIGLEAPKNDRLEVGGSLRILSGTNPVRFTSVWTGFPDAANNQAEICNDTTYHKALMIVGNRSAGQGRKVSIWDRLDVNGLLYVNGSMQVSQVLTPSAGKGNNGIIFPSDPGGGSGDSAWIKYYPRSGEACTLEIGTSNDRDDNISLMASGNVGIGTISPADKLDVNGWVRLLSDSNPLRFTSAWNPSNDPGTDNYAEICNDTSKYKSLIIIGNRSGGRERKVSVWDRLEVNGLLQVTGNFQPANAIVPSVGYGEDKGIMFPKDPGGGAGDAAWIRYYSDPRRGGGENMTLEIGISNDSGGGGYLSGGDHLRLYASGGVYVDGYFYYSSSREYKENISGLATQKAKEILDGLNPVTFNFKGDTAKTTMGFIAEDVPAAVAAHDKKAISPMEIITVLTSVVKDQKKTIAKLQKQLETIARSKK